MKKFFSLNRKITKSDPKTVDKSVSKIEREVEIVSNEINCLEKRFRIESKRLNRIECDLNEEIEKTSQIDKQIEDKTRLKENLIEEINRKSKYVESIVESNRDLEQMIKSLTMELNHKSEEQKQQMIEYNRIRDQFSQRLDSRRNAYELVDCRQFEATDTDSNINYKQLSLKNNELKDIESDIKLIETQIEELIKTKSFGFGISRQLAEDYSDPILVITEMAKIKMNSNEMQEILEDMLGRRQDFETESNATNDEYIRVNEKTSETFYKKTEKDAEMQSSSQIDSNLKIDSFLVDTSAQQNCPPISSTSIFSANMFSQAMSPQSNVFGFGDCTDRPNTSTSFSLFGNPSDSANTNQSLFGLFGKSPTEDQNRSSNLGFNVFSSRSTDDSVGSNTSPQSFNLFK